MENFLNMCDEFSSKIDLEESLRLWLKSVNLLKLNFAAGMK
jgi:hypothetical protein